MNNAAEKLKIKNIENNRKIRAELCAVVKLGTCTYVSCDECALNLKNPYNGTHICMMIVI